MTEGGQETGTEGQPVMVIEVVKNGVLRKTVSTECPTSQQAAEFIVRRIYDLEFPESVKLTWPGGEISWTTPAEFLAGGTPIEIKPTCLTDKGQALTWPLPGIKLVPVIEPADS